MKSQKAKEFLQENMYPSAHKLAIIAVELAEQEMMEKAVNAHRKQCDALSEFDICDRVGFTSCNCNSTCGYMEDFINQLNNE